MTTTAMTRRNRARGLLLAAAIGDAMGAPFEGRAEVEETDLLAEERAPSRLVHTDDTALLLVLAEHLAARREDDAPLDEDVLAEEFARAWQAEPWRGYGPGAAEIFRLVNAGMPWREATRSLFQGQGSHGNGAAMRVAPVALVATSPHHAAELAVRSAELTHAHKHGQHGAACQAVAVHLALGSDPSRPLDTTRFVHDLGRVVRSTPWHEKFDRITELAHRQAGPEHAARALGNDVSALGSVPLALLAFLRHPDQPAEAIHFAILAGGDTDTIASMAGAIAGARNGADPLPEAWIDRLEAGAQLTALAGRLS